MRFAPTFAFALALCTLTLTAGCASDTTPADAGSGIDAAYDAGRGTDDADVDGGDDAASAGDTGIDAGLVNDAGSDAARDAGVRVPMYHRADDSECTAAAPAGNCSFGGGGGISCAADSDCTSGTNGRCNMNIGGAAFCRCTYDTCVHDTDCATGETCACHGATYHADGNECIAGNCRTDADCGANGFCSPTIGGCGSLAGYYCHTASDTCVDDTDCTSGGGLQACEYVSASARWECVDRLFCP